MKWTLKAISEELKDSSFSIHEDTLVGRHQSCHLVLQSSEISRRHAAFYIKDQALWLEDLQSSNGTYINGNKITEPTLLKDQDLIQFASLKFILNESKSEENTAVEDQPLKANAEEGMPPIADRVKDTPVANDGTPENIQIPKPAPMPEQEHEIASKHESVAQNENHHPTDSEQEVKKNASLGLITIIAILIIALIVWFFFK